MGPDAPPPPDLAAAPRTSDASPRSQAINTRDAGLTFVRRANRWMIAGAVALAAGLSGVTAHAFAAKSAAAAHAVSARPAPGANDGGGSGTGLQSPSAAPAPAPAPAAPPVVSGGS